VTAELGPSAQAFADGGLRTGQDVLAALGLGTRAVFLGRPVLWALACGGVRDLLTGMTSDLAHVMALAGAAALAGVAGVTAATAAHSL
jgi:4-hydroxymandelate oxidase